MNENLEILTILEEDDDISITSIEEINNNNNLIDCVICMQIILPNEYVSADHGFFKHPYAYHKECWEEYLKNFDTCPICRESLKVNEVNVNGDNFRHFFIRPVDIQYVDGEDARLQLMTIEQLLLITTLAQSVVIQYNDPSSIFILKSIVNFYVTTRTFSNYLRRFHTCTWKYLFSFYICFSITSMLINNYFIIIDTIVNVFNDNITEII